MRHVLSWISWQRVPVVRMPRPDEGRDALLWTGFALFYAALAVLTGLLIRAHPVPLWGSGRFTEDAWYVFGFKLMALLVLPAALLLLRGYGRSDLLPCWRWRWRLLLSFPLVFVIGIALNLGHLSGIRHALQGGGAGLLVVVVGAACLPLFTAALPEELVFRALLQTRLEACLGRWAAIGLSALLFTAWHLPTRYLLSEGVEGSAGDLGSVLAGTGLPVLIVGLVFGWAWDRWRSLPHLVLAHWAVDLLTSVSSLLGVRF